MSYNKNVCIGIAVNSAYTPDAPSIENQYTTSDKVFNQLTEVLEACGARVIKIEANQNLFGKIAAYAEELDVVFNLAEDIYQVAIPMAVDQVKLELNTQNLVCTASGVEGHTLALNKAFARQSLLGKVEQPNWWYIDGNVLPQLRPEDFPVIIKPTNEGHSIGIHQKSVVQSMEALQEQVVELRKRFKGKLIVESFLDGNEYSMGMVGNVVMPAVAWDLNQLPGQPLVRGEDLKQQDLTIPHATIVQNLELQKALAQQVIQAHLGLSLQGYSRSDFRANKEASIPAYIETNTLPGLQDVQSILPWSAAKAGVAYAELIASIIWQALQKLPEAHLASLNTSKFEQAYRRLQAQPSEAIDINGRQYLILQATKKQAIPTAISTPNEQTG